MVYCKIEEICVLYNARYMVYYVSYTGCILCNQCLLLEMCFKVYIVHSKLC